MPKTARPHPKPIRKATFLREWRKCRDLSLERVVERLQVEHGYELSVGQLSRIERAEQAYNQDLLEVLAKIYQAGDAASLLIRDPTDPAGIWSLWETLEPVQRRQAVEILQALKRTGTAG